VQVHQFKNGACRRGEGGNWCTVSSGKKTNGAGPRKKQGGNERQAVPKKRIEVAGGIPGDTTAAAEKEEGGCVCGQEKHGEKGPPARVLMPWEKSGGFQKQQKRGGGKE